MKVITEHKIATESPDHLFPWGTARDNTTDLGFIGEIENYFNKKIKTLDIGCSGGQLTIDFHNRGHLAVGIEGSDFSLNNGRANWSDYNNKLLFTCDATKPYKIAEDDDQMIKFDLITAWEVLEHIDEPDFDIFFKNILDHMEVDSIFCASICPEEDIIEGFKLHQSVFDKDVWFSKLSKYFDVYDMPFNNKVRYGSSFHVLCKKKK